MFCLLYSLIAGWWIINTMNTHMYKELLVMRVFPAMFPDPSQINTCHQLPVDYSRCFICLWVYTYAWWKIISPYPFQGSFMPEYNRKTNASVTAIMDHMESSVRTAVIDYADGTLLRSVEALGQMQCGQSNLKVWFS